MPGSMVTTAPDEISRPPQYVPGVRVVLFSILALLKGWQEPLRGNGTDARGAATRGARVSGMGENASLPFTSPVTANTEVFMRALPTARTAELSDEFACAGQLVVTLTVPFRSMAPLSVLLSAITQIGSETPFFAAAATLKSIVSPPIRPPNGFVAPAAASPVTLTSSVPEPLTWKVGDCGGAALRACWLRDPWNAASAVALRSP